MPSTEWGSEYILMKSFLLDQAYTILLVFSSTVMNELTFLVAHPPFIA